MERMFTREVLGLWRRIERRSPSGRLLDYVEVGECSDCGRGVDKAHPVEYRLIGGELYCAPCAEPEEWAQRDVVQADAGRPAT